MKTQVNTLNSLPDEVLLNICEFLNQIDVLPFILINRKCKDVGMKKLYRCIYCNNGEPIVISSKFYSDFYCSFTIMNNIETWSKIGKNLELTESVTFFTDGHDPLVQWIKGYNPSVRIIAEKAPLSDSHEELNKCKELYIFRDIVDVPVHNHSIKKLVFDFSYKRYVNLKIVPHLLNLESLEIRHGNSIVFDQFRDNGLSNLKIRKLSLELGFRYRDTLEKEMTDTFQVNQITSLELKFNFFDKKTYLYESELTKLAPQLTNIRHFSIIVQKFPIDKVIEKFNPNTLESLYIVLDPCTRSYVIPQFHDILQSQEDSITRFYFNTSSFESALRHSGLQEFERIYDATQINTPRSQHNNIDDTNKFFERSHDQIIRDLLEEGSCFINMKHIVLYEKHFLIKRKELADIEVEALN
ncbi:uncharacterized protein SPAPADRAFT_65889 [Spathaspora passalidarum NRRL Y-27907]|uniref:F-box domain-containing protein n=1 Tax=Spathaspora passalidarum (strain NRRL Y-27907 / 11-Y1) TaxID=619300 RepID=G3AK56_SPAPN|nr:uncharacterized protein SPAPADRAFT_65889 [Spathaspora passalidarum NRRL Y-27907]EGW32867.1 hypothetical protein SPAPADRAFT_65889 [Spathaspora passalidarum NRRL Y-27907]